MCAWAVNDLHADCVCSCVTLVGLLLHCSGRVVRGCVAWSRNKTNTETMVAVYGVAEQDGTRRGHNCKHQCKICFETVRLSSSMQQPSVLLSVSSVAVAFRTMGNTNCEY